MIQGILVDEQGVQRCWWPGTDPLYQRYHDREWGHPVRDGRRLFEKICLEGFQSGLSWLTILRKRENFRRAFHDFEYEKVSRYGARHVERLLEDSGIVRHRGKIESTINNARRALELEREFGSLAAYFWQYEPLAPERPQRLTRSALAKLTKTPASLALSRDLKRRGWSFVGPTTCYAFMQAMGLVNDHLEGCVYRDSVEAKRNRFRRPKSSSRSAGRTKRPRIFRAME